MLVAGWQRWEHLVGHHDELTDIVSLGELLSPPVRDRPRRRRTSPRADRRPNNLFALAPALHPVLATVASSMIAPDRRRRAQDLRSLIEQLDTYRDQPLDFDLEREHHAARRPRAAVLESLRDRLFDLSRRNPLINFRPTGRRPLNLTEVSVPLMLDVRNIRASSCSRGVAGLRATADGKAPDARQVVRYDEAPYAATSLDKLISTARRDRAEYGQDQLRLVRRSCAGTT